MKILYVCTGNICRSPLAEVLTRHEALKRGLGPDRLKIESAGTQGYHVGDPPDHRSIDVARRWGVRMDGKKARQVVPEDFARFDLILAMDRRHLKALRRLAPSDASARIELFMLFAAGVDQDVPDPYYGHIEDFLHVRDMVADGVTKLFDKLNNV